MVAVLVIGWTEPRFQRGLILLPCLTDGQRRPYLFLGCSLRQSVEASHPNTTIPMQQTPHHTTPHLTTRFALEVTEAVIDAVGAASKVAIRLSPFGHYLISPDPHTYALYSYLLTELVRLCCAVLCCGLWTVHCAVLHSCNLDLLVNLSLPPPTPPSSTLQPTPQNKYGLSYVHLVEPREDDLPVSVVIESVGGRPDTLAPFRQAGLIE